jgi:tetratricopeptide (TPR) repeat protein
MLGPGAPDAESVAAALGAAQDIRKKAPNDPLGYAAYCDVAARIGDTVMLERYARELERIAPKDPETARAKEALALSSHGIWRRSIGALIVLVPLLGTMIHKMARTLRSRARRAPVIAAAVLSMAGLFASGWARADDAGPQRSAAAPPVGAVPQPGNIGTWAIDDKDPESSVPTEAKRNRDPVEFGYWLQDLTAKGQEAAKRGDHEAAVRYFRALVKAVPDRAIGVTRLCDEYEALGEREKAVAACEVALAMDGVTFRDYAHYVKLILAKSSALSSEETAQVRKVFEHLREDPTVVGSIVELECRFAVRISDTDELQRCVVDAKATAPDAPSTLVYEWDLALARGDHAAARQLLESARAKGMNPASIERMENEMRAKATSHQLLVLYGTVFVGCAIIAVAAGVLLARRSGTKKGTPADEARAPANAGS